VAGEIAEAETGAVAEDEIDERHRAVMRPAPMN
jgi:hypothetical protein